MRVRNWKKFQHYKHRNPAWIKLHRSLLNDPEWFALDGDASKVLAMCWLVAADYAGELPKISLLAFRLRISSVLLAKQISKLGHWLEYDASELLADCKQDATTEYRVQSTEKKEKEDTANAVLSDSLSIPDSLKRYAFESGIIRLNATDFQKWTVAFGNLELSAELLQLTEFAQKNPDNWFFAVQGALAKRNREVKERANGTAKERRKSESRQALDKLRNWATDGDIGGSTVPLLPRTRTGG